MFDTPVTALSGVGPARAEALARRGIATVLDLLHLVPSRYRSPDALADLAEAVAGDRLSYIGHVLSRRKGRMRRRRGGYLDLTLESDDGRQLRARFYSQAWLFDRFPIGARALLCGRLAPPTGDVLVCDHHRVLEDDEDPAPHLDVLLPQLPAVEGVSPGILGKLIGAARALVVDRDDPLPASVREAHGLLGIVDAFAAVHAPESREIVEEGGARLLFDRFVALLLPVARGRPTDEGAPVIDASPKVRSRIRARFPFALTEGQQAALEVVLADLARPVPMRRLLQGDVGAGKTAVAVAAALATVASGRQVLLLAPTEPLAHQHHDVVSHLLLGSRVEIGLLSGRIDAAARRALVASLPDGSPHFLVGTHAALSESVRFRELGLVIVDEQQRFGVRQRLAARTRSMGAIPHVLAMSATPIPRSLCLALMGDLDHTIIPDRPPGREPCETVIDAGEGAWRAVREAVARGERAFVVFPAIDAEEMPALLREGVALVKSGGLRGLPCVLLHGRMHRDERDAALAAFRDGRAPLLLSTIMVEVGLDVADATTMVVVGAERFGLASLHQLRGRVGRGRLPGRCVLVPGPALSTTGEERLAVLVRETDGFRIAEADLLLRGPGELAGVRQAGAGGPLPVSPGRDESLLAGALDAARSLVADGRADDVYWRRLGSSVTEGSSLPQDAV